MNGLSQKQYLELPLPTEDDPRSDQQRILDSLMAAGVEERVHIPVHILRKLYPLLDNAKWKITVSLALLFGDFGLRLVCFGGGLVRLTDGLLQSRVSPFLVRKAQARFLIQTIPPT